MTKTRPDTLSRPTTRAARIEQVLHASFTPSHLSVVDDSARHAGHSGATAAGETHYSVTMVTPAFLGMNRVTRARVVHDALAPEFARGLHALVLSLRTPEEWKCDSVSRS